MLVESSTPTNEDDSPEATYTQLTSSYAYPSNLMQAMYDQLLKLHKNVEVLLVENKDLKERLIKLEAENQKVQTRILTEVIAQRKLMHGNKPRLLLPPKPFNKIEDLQKFEEDLCNSAELSEQLEEEIFNYNISDPAKFIRTIWRKIVMDEVAKESIISKIENFVHYLHYPDQFFASLRASWAGLRWTVVDALQPTRTATCQALTPGHFLIGRPLNSIAEPFDEAILKLSATNRWKRIVAVHHAFWRRWSLEYLTLLQERSKWTSTCSNIQQGTLVLIGEDNTPPGQWALGRVHEVHTGADGAVRVVTIKTKTGFFKRNVHKICPLPMADRNQENLEEASKAGTNTTSRTPQRRARETTLDGQGAVQGILWCSAGSKNYGDLVGIS
ncbi:hypothetical protein ACLKA6_008468 [Drosophila palustris]